jgi:hypothetical protein
MCSFHRREREEKIALGLGGNTPTYGALNSSNAAAMGIGTPSLFSLLTSEGGRSSISATPPPASGSSTSTSALSPPIMAKPTSAAADGSGTVPGTVPMDQLPSPGNHHSSFPAEGEKPKVPLIGVNVSSYQFDPTDPCPTLGMCVLYFSRFNRSICLPSVISALFLRLLLLA